MTFDQGQQRHQAVDRKVHLMHRLAWFIQDLAIGDLHFLETADQLRVFAGWQRGEQMVARTSAGRLGSAACMFRWRGLAFPFARNHRVRGSVASDGRDGERAYATWPGSIAD